MNSDTKYDVKRVVGKKLSMGKAAFMTVQEYVRRSGTGLTFAQLRKAFPKKVNGKYDVVQKTAERHVQAEYPETHGGIMLSDGTLVLVTNHWYKEGKYENWSRFIKNAKRHGIEIVIS